jgi:predicted HTH domain antitoxin
MTATREIRIEYGEELLAGTGMSHEEFMEEARFLLAAKLYELGRITSGQAARMCGKNRVDFLFSLPRIGVAISNLDAADAEAEIRFAENA